MKEKVGPPDLFTGRKEELAKYLDWIDRIKREISKSTAILSRRKTGKTALMQRLYNLTFHKNNGVVPFYYELREGKRWAVDFCKDFFLTFIYQYIAFKTRKKQYLRFLDRDNLGEAIKAARKEKLDYLVDVIKSVEYSARHENVDNLWDSVREAPLAVATMRDEFVVQLIDEFQLLNSEICRDRAAVNVIDDFAAGYHRTAEYRNAPLLVSGSQVGWLMNLLIMMLPGRFRMNVFENMPEDEAIEMAFNYSRVMNVPVTEETAYMITEISEGNPFYISSIFESHAPNKDLETKEGLLRTLAFETLNDQGYIKGAWMEYVHSAFKRVNGANAKNIVLYLCKHRHREVTREELLKKLELDMTDSDLETKMDALVKADIIDQGKSNYRYRAVADNIFDKVFRAKYAEEIERFDEKEITYEYKELFRKSEEKYFKLLGKFNQAKGAWAEYLIINQLRTRAHRNRERFLSMTENLPGDFQFMEYESVWRYYASPVDKSELEIDVFARAGKDEYSIIGEVKNRETKKFSEEEAAAFLKKMEELKEMEKIEKAVGFVFSPKGFTGGALQFFKEHRIAWSDDERWMG